MAFTMDSEHFPSILRQPDLVLGATESTPFRFEERCNHCDSPVVWSYEPTSASWQILIHPGKEPVKFLKLRWHGDFSRVESVLGDEWGRISATHTPVEWRSVMPWRPLPWFCLVRTGDSVGCYGVKTGCDCFAFFQVDTRGITLFLNLMSGGRGTVVKESFSACTVTETVSHSSETVYQTAKRFMSMLCDHPVLPKEPIFGVNDWYWAYGNISREIVLRERDYLLEMTDGVKHRPSLVIDDGWQLNRTTQPHSYIGGPFAYANERFGDMRSMAGEIAEKGIRPGIWIRPLLTLGTLPEEAKLRSYANGMVMDPSHPYTLERVREDAARIRGWGFEIMKHDFTGNDAFGCEGFSAANFITHGLADQRNFYDNTKTTATILKNLYKAIQDGAGDADVIGCSVIGHLSAGIHSIQRVGTDNSGRSFEWTARNGVHSFIRLPMNDTFFRMDPDCAAFTKEVDAEMNLMFLQLCALTNVTTLASVTPGILSEKEMMKINEIYRLADQNQDGYGIANYERCVLPEVFTNTRGENVTFDWMKAYDGSRSQLTWYK